MVAFMLFVATATYGNLKNYFYLMHAGIFGTTILTGALLPLTTVLYLSTRREEAKRRLSSVETFDRYFVKIHLGNDEEVSAETKDDQHSFEPGMSANLGDL